MKKKQKDELKLKNSIELRNLLKVSRDLLFKMRLEKSQNKLKNLRGIFNERKRIAFMLTILKNKEIEEQSPKLQKKVKINK